MVSDSELLAEPESRSVVTVHRDFRLWLIVPTEASTSLPGGKHPLTSYQVQERESNYSLLTWHSTSSTGMLTQSSMPVFWNQSLELGRILIDSLDSQQGLCTQPLTQTLPLFFLHGLLLHRQLYGLKLQAHRGRW